MFKVILNYFLKFRNPIIRTVFTAESISNQKQNICPFVAKHPFVSNQKKSYTRTGTGRLYKASTTDYDLITRFLDQSQRLRGKQNTDRRVVTQRIGLRLVLDSL